MLKEKILAELRKKYPGLSSSVLGLLAEKLEPTTTEESQIEGAVAALENLPIKPSDYAAFLQKESDRRVTEALRKKTPETEPKPKEDETDPKDPTSKLAKQLEALQQKLDSFERKESQRTIEQKLHDKLKEKKIPAQFARGILIEKEEDLETAVLEAETSYQEVKQHFTNAGLITGLPKPGGTGAPAGTDKTAAQVDADIKAWAEKGKSKN
jgi:hypothetical protein